MYKKSKSYKSFKKKSTKKDSWIACKRYFGNRCAYCGKYCKLTKDHVIPRHSGGTDSAYNIIPACQSCNSSKRERPFLTWYRKQPYYNPIREIVILQYLYR